MTCGPDYERLWQSARKAYYAASSDAIKLADENDELRAESARLRELLRESARVHGDEGNQAMEQRLCEALEGKGT
jgi:hypothetical protein